MMIKTFRSRYNREEITIGYNGKNGSVHFIDLSIGNTTIRRTGLDVHGLDPFRETRSVLEKFDKWWKKQLEKEDKKNKGGN